MLFWQDPTQMKHWHRQIFHLVDWGIQTRKLLVTGPMLLITRLPATIKSLNISQTVLFKHYEVRSDVGSKKILSHWLETHCRFKKYFPTG
jgi:plasmid rolling circle replication initiator protein Rep